MFGEKVRIDPVDDDALQQRRETDCQRAFRHPVTRHKRAGIESRRCQQLGKAVRQLRTNRFGADACDAPRRKVIPDDVLGTDPASAKVVAEWRAERNGRLGAGHQLQPAPRAHGEVTGVEIVDRALRRHRRQHAADEPHVMIERQPGYAAVIRPNIEAMIDDAVQVAEYRFLLYDHAARETGAPRRVLQVRRLGGAARPQRDILLRQLVECGGRSYERQVNAFGCFAKEALKLA